MQKRAVPMFTPEVFAFIIFERLKNIKKKQVIVSEKFSSTFVILWYPPQWKSNWLSTVK